MAQVALSTKLSPEMYDWLEKYSKATGIPKAQIIEEALKDYRKKQEK